jgi:hypothetical protein
MSANPSAFVITPEFIKLRVRHYLGVAKVELQAAGPDDDTDLSNFNPKGTVVMPDGTEHDLPLGHKGYEDKRRKMYAVSQTCKVIGASALIVRFLATAPDLAKIGAEMHLSVPHPLMDHAKFEYFQERLNEFVRKKTGGSERFGKLPREYIKDFVIVSAIGPGLEDSGVLAPFDWKDGKLIVDESQVDKDGGQCRFDMVPKWWE